MRVSLRLRSGMSQGRLDHSVGPRARVVEFKAAHEAQHAISTLNNTELDGRNIFLREVSPG
jgi:hypothetical protein